MKVASWWRSIAIPLRVLIKIFRAENGWIVEHIENGVTRSRVVTDGVTGAKDGTSIDIAVQQVRKAMLGMAEYV